jgi:Protein of unknown function (DUF3631)
MSVELDNVLSRLHGVMRNGDGFTAMCPAHKDRRASLSVRDGEKAVLVKCHAGCTAEAVVAELGLALHELFFNSPAKNNGHGNHARHARIIATYPYVDETGALLFEVLRFDPKNFKQRKPNGNGGWIPKLGTVRRVPYRLPEVLAANDVFVLEGEKDCDNARQLGFVATCNSGGAGKWREEFSEVLRGKNIVIIQDADEPGRKHSQKVAMSLWSRAASIKVLELPGAKDLSEWIERGGTREMLLEIIRNTPEWKPSDVPEPVNSETAGGTRDGLIELVNATPESMLTSADGAPLLDSISTFIRRFISLSESQARVVALWVAHTHALAAADATPYLAITSPEKRSGKTQLLELCGMLVANPWLTGRVTAAVLIRKVDKVQPTLLLDESDAAFGGEKEYAETLRGVLNTGHRRGGKASCCVGQGANITFQDFSTFCPKAIAGIGMLPDTVADRAIPIRLKRKGREERVERFRLRNVAAETATLHGQIAAWIRPLIDLLRNARPLLPEELTDRQQDGVEPLLAIADVAGGNWPQTARQALVELCTDSGGTDDSFGERLLADIRQIFETRGQDRISSAELTAALAELETSPWSEWSNGKPITQPKVARLLRRFDVMPYPIRIGDRIVRGCERADFSDAFSRYLPVKNFCNPPGSQPQTVTPLQVKTGAGSSGFQGRNTGIDVTGQKRKIANTGAACNGVTVSNATAGPEQPFPTGEQAFSEGSPERFGQPHARLFPLIGKQVWTPRGTGRLETAYATGCGVALDSTPGRLTVLRPDEIRIGDLEKATDMAAVPEASKRKIDK